MNKQAESNKTPSNVQLFFTSKWFWIPLVCFIIGTLLYVGRQDGPLTAAYKALGVPSDWRQTGKTSENGPSCLLSDNACPADHYVFYVNNLETLPNAFSKISQKLVNSNYKIEDECLNPSCGNAFINVSGNDVSIQISQREGTNEHQIVLDIESHTTSE